MFENFWTSLVNISEERLYSSELVIVSFSYSKLASKGIKIFEERIIDNRKLLVPAVP
jgi:hypothetical protein